MIRNLVGTIQGHGSTFFAAAIILPRTGPSAHQTFVCLTIVNPVAANGGSEVRRVLQIVCMHDRTLTPARWLCVF